MANNWKHTHYVESNIVFRKLEGNFKLNDIVESWKKILNELKNKQVIGIINDITNANLEMELREVDKIISFFKEHSSIFDNVFIAVVTDNPKTIVFPTIAAIKNPYLKIKTFSSEEAAKMWILDNS